MIKHLAAEIEDSKENENDEKGTTTIYMEN